MFDLKKTTSETGCELYAKDSWLASGMDFRGDRENWNLLLPLEGTAWLQYGGSRKIALTPYSLFLLKPMTNRFFSVRSDWHVQWIHFNLDAHLQYEPEWPECVPGMYMLQLPEAERKSFQQIFLEISSLCRVRKLGWYRLAYCLIQEIILRGNMLCGGGCNQQAIEKALPLLEPLNSKETIRQMASKCSLSKSSLYRYFKETFGIGPAAYREQRVMNKAQSLLEETTLSIKEITETLQQKNAAYFSTRFKVMFGMKPSEYRKLHHMPPTPPPKNFKVKKGAGSKNSSDL